MAYQTIKGMYDVYGEEYRYFEKIDTLFKHFAELYGYEMIKTPILEYTGVFKKDNDTSDMVTKEMYTFTLNNKDYLTLRPEGTAGVIRSFVQNKMYGNELPVKLAYIGEMFRHERPQKGRQRQFNQLGIENIGNKDPLIDAEVVLLKFHGVRAEPILEAVALFHVLSQVEGKGRRLRTLEEIPEQLQPGGGVQFPSHRGQLRQVIDEVRAYTGEIGAGFIDIPLGYRDGDVAVLHHAVVGAGNLGEQHFIVLPAEMVQAILPHGEQQGFLELRLVDPPVVDGDFGAGPGIQSVEEL